MLEHVRSAPERAGEGLGHVGVTHKNARVMDGMQIDAGTYAVALGGEELL